VARFLEERGQLYGVVNQGSWVKTFSMPEQHQSLSVKVYLLSYLDETREDWHPALEANPPNTPRRYREKFDQDRYPPPDSSTQDTPTDEAGTYGTYIPESDHDFADGDRTTSSMALAQLPEPDGDNEADDESSVVTPSFSEVEEQWKMSLYRKPKWRWKKPTPRPDSQQNAFGAGGTSRDLPFRTGVRSASEPRNVQKEATASTRVVYFHCTPRVRAVSRPLGHASCIADPSRMMCKYSPCADSPRIVSLGRRHS
jgi:hypothetical protein